MSDFMQVEITTKQHGWSVDTAAHGTEWIPDSVCGSLPGFTGGDVDEQTYKGLEPFTQASAAQLREEANIDGVVGYFGRLHAPGYLDCTDWTFDTNYRRLERELKRELRGDG